MKLATYKDGSRDGQLVVVSRDLGLAHYATGTATRLQQVLDDWNFLSPQLQDLYVTLNQGKARHAFAFDPRQCMAPLPRAGLWAEGAAPGGNARLLGATDDAFFGAEAWGIDLGAQLAAITGDVDTGASPDQGLDGIRLLVLANAWSLRALEPAERAAGLGLVHSRPATSFGPVAVTPDELGDAWQGGRAQLTLQTSVNGKRLGLTDAGPGDEGHFGQLIAHLAKTRPVRAGSIVGAGLAEVADAAKGFASLASKRAGEAAGQGDAQTPWLRHGDTVRIEVKGRDGMSLFGAIDQQVRTADAPPEAAPDEAHDTRATEPPATE